MVLGLYCSYKKFHIFKFYTFLYFYTKTLGPLLRHLFDFLLKFLAKNQISAFKVLLVFSCMSTKMCKIKKYKTLYSYNKALKPGLSSLFQARMLNGSSQDANLPVFRTSGCSLFGDLICLFLGPLDAQKPKFPTTSSCHESTT